MNPKQIQFQHQWVAVLLFAGLILALAASLVWIRIETTAFFQTVKMTQACAYSPQPGQMETSAAEGDYSSKSIEGSKLGGGTEGVSSRGCKSELHLNFITGRKPGVSSGN